MQEGRLDASLVSLIVEEWVRIKKLLDERLEEIASAGVEAGLEDVAEYIMRGGKRFRGFLVVVTAEALGGTVEEALDAAVAIELVHSASLALDDIIDQDKERRGRLVAWMVHGLQRTLLTSLLMIPVAQRMVERYGLRAIMHVSRAWEATVRGEVIDVLLASRIGARRYPELAALKTGSLFKLAGVLGAIAAGAQAWESRVAVYGEKLGVAYQLADDIVDYYKYMKGLRAKLDPSEELYARWAREVLGAGSDEEVIEYSLRELARTVSQASEAVKALPATRGAEILRAIPRFMAEKMLEEAGLTLPPP